MHITTMSDTKLAKQYQKKSDREHVLDNPDTYTGTMEETEYSTYVYDDATDSIIAKDLTMIP